MKMKTNTLTGRALDYAVALAEGHTFREVRGKGATVFDGVFIAQVPGGWKGQCATLVLDSDNTRKMIKACEDSPFYVDQRYWRPTTGSAGDEIIDREGITTIRCDDYGTDAQGFTTSERIPVWAAAIGQHSYSESTEHQQHEPMYQIGTDDVVYGATRREAAMRCWAIYKLSKCRWGALDLDFEIDLPEGF
jgi:hypothetical protein